MHSRELASTAGGDSSLNLPVVVHIKDFDIGFQIFDQDPHHLFAIGSCTRPHPVLICLSVQYRDRLAEEEEK